MSWSALMTGPGWRLVKQLASAQLIEHVARIAAGIAMYEQPRLAVADAQARRPIAAAFAVRWHRTRHEKRAIRETLCAPASKHGCDLARVHAFPSTLSLRKQRRRNFCISWSLS